jgi:hypothetical protein
MLHQSTGRDRKREPSNSYVPLSETNGDARPGFPVVACFGEVHAAFLNESRTRGRVQRSVQEIRVLTND